MNIIKLTKQNAATYASIIGEELSPGWYAISNVAGNNMGPFASKKEAQDGFETARRARNIARKAAAPSHILRRYEAKNN